MKIKLKSIKFKYDSFAHKKKKGYEQNYTLNWYVINWLNNEKHKQ